MSALTVVQTVCRRIGIQVPNSAVSSSDPQIQQLLALVSEEGQALASRHPWEVLTKEATLTTVAQQSQGAMSTLAPNYRYIVNDTIWDRTDTRPIFGPLTASRWQNQRARNLTGPYAQYRIRGGELLCDPIPPAGHTWAFEYVTRNWVSDVGNTTSRSAYQQDDDYALLDEQLIALGARWRWLEAKGMTYSEAFAEYERQVADAIARDGTKPVLNMGMQDRTVLFIPEGSWDL